MKKAHPVSRATHWHRASWGRHSWWPRGWPIGRALGCVLVRGVPGGGPCPALEAPGRPVRGEGEGHPSPRRCGEEKARRWDYPSRPHASLFPCWMTFAVAPPFVLLRRRFAPREEKRHEERWCYVVPVVETKGSSWSDEQERDFVMEMVEWDARVGKGWQGATPPGSPLGRR